MLISYLTLFDFLLGKCNPDVQDTFTGNHALHIAAKMGNLNLIMALLEGGANLELCNSSGYLPIHLGIFKNSRKAVNYILEKRPQLVNIKVSSGNVHEGIAIKLQG